MCPPRNINLSQQRILRRLKHFKEIHRPTHDQSQYNEGHCEGFTASFLYGKWVSLNKHRLIHKENQEWFQKNMEQLSSLNPYTLHAKQVNDIEGFSNKICRFQNPETIQDNYRQGEYHISMTNELGNKPILEYSLVGSFKHGDLRKPNRYQNKKGETKLTTPLSILSQPYRLVHIRCYQHATGLISDENNTIYFYDSNHVSGTIAFDNFNISQLERMILNAHGDQNQAILSFKCFHFKEDTLYYKTPFYPAQEQILRNLSGDPIITSPTNHNNARSTTHLAQYMGCQASYDFYKNKLANKNPCFDVDRWKKLGHSHNQFFSKEDGPCQKASLSPAVPAASEPSAPEI